MATCPSTGSWPIGTWDAKPVTTQDHTPNVYLPSFKTSFTPPVLPAGVTVKQYEVTWMMDAWFAGAPDPCTFLAYYPGCGRWTQYGTTTTLYWNNSMLNGATYNFWGTGYHYMLFATLSDNSKISSPLYSQAYSYPQPEAGIPFAEMWNPDCVGCATTQPCKDYVQSVLSSGSLVVQATATTTNTTATKHGKK